MKRTRIGNRRSVFVVVTTCVAVLIGILWIGWDDVWLAMLEWRSAANWRRMSPLSEVQCDGNEDWPNVTLVGTASAGSSGIPQTFLYP